MKLNEKLFNLRKDKSLTQKQVADILEIDKSTYAHYEFGRRTPSIDKLKDAVETCDNIKGLGEALKPILDARDEVFTFPDFSAERLLRQEGRTVFRDCLDLEVEQLINKYLGKQSRLIRERYGRRV